MDALADVSGYSELHFAPVIPIGHSACATYPWNFAAWNPGRTLAILSVHGDAPQTTRTGNGKPRIDWGDRNIDGVPGLMVMGEYEWSEDRLTPALEFIAKHPRTPMAFLADAGHGHFDYGDGLVSFLAMFIRKAAQQRLPRDCPLDAPVPLKPIDPTTGWRMDRWRKDQSPTAPAAPYSNYVGDTKQAFWCFDEEMAAATESCYAANRGKKPQLIGFVQGGQTYSGEPANPKFLPDADGITFHLTARFLDAVSGSGTNPARCSGLPNGTPLGHATGVAPIVISKIVGPVAKLGPETFALRLDRSVYTANGRNNDIWLVAHHPGDETYKSIVQQAIIRVQPNKDGIAQQITFPRIADQVEGVSTIPLAATSNANLPVSYYVRDGPADVEGDILRITPIPPRSKIPINITVVAWQWGRMTEPKVQTAATVEITFNIKHPSK
jgi:hypothetical protein